MTVVFAKQQVYWIWPSKNLNITIVLMNPNHTRRLLAEHLSILPLGGLKDSFTFQFVFM